MATSATLAASVKQAARGYERSKRKRAKPTERGGIVAESDARSRQRNAARAARFAAAASPATASLSASPPASKKQRRRQARRDAASASSEGASAARIVGTCEALEKAYFRITSAPDPSTVRPLRVLRRALVWVQGMWSDAVTIALAADDDDDDDDDDFVRDRSRPPSVDSDEYAPVCEQLKSIRQDCTLQGLEGDFAIKVYETHARIALEAGDFDEFNRCQTKLAELHLSYEMRSLSTAKSSSAASHSNRARLKAGADERELPAVRYIACSTSSQQAGLHPHRGEFLAYRVLYELSSSLQSAKHGRAALTGLLQSLPAHERALPPVHRALRVVRAALAGDYFEFWRLHTRVEESGDMEIYLIEELVAVMRNDALLATLAAFRPTLPCKVLQRMLGFRTARGAMGKKREASACRAWLRKRDVVLRKFSAEEDDAEEGKKQKKKKKKKKKQKRVRWVLDVVATKTRLATLNRVERGGKA